jgi:molybdopterin/thiamine biosynthesis adenylyltransferase
MEKSDPMRQDRYARQILFREIGESGQRRLAGATVLIIGCGALGTVSANHLARAGIGYIRIIDRDYVELSNLQRQILFDETDALNRIPKAVAAAQKLEKINSDIRIESIMADVNPGNIEELIDDVDLVLDATDNMEIRYLINDACVKHQVPWIYAGVIGAVGMTMTIMPGKTACFHCLMQAPPEPGTMPSCETVGVLNGAPGVIASIQAVESMRILTGHPSPDAALIYVDLWNQEFKRLSVERHRGCPVCDGRHFDFLSGDRYTETFSLCGRNAVQISLAQGSGFSIEKLKNRLADMGEVSDNGFFLTFKVDAYELNIFPEGRTMIKGTTDESVARSLFARYIGA